MDGWSVSGPTGDRDPVRVDKLQAAGFRRHVFGPHLQERTGLVESPRVALVLDSTVAHYQPSMLTRVRRR